MWPAWGKVNGYFCTLMWSRWTADGAPTYLANCYYCMLQTVHIGWLLQIISVFQFVEFPLWMNILSTWPLIVWKKWWLALWPSQQDCSGFESVFILHVFLMSVCSSKKEAPLYCPSLWMWLWMVVCHWPLQGIPHLSPAECWDRLQLHKTLQTIFFK